MVQQDPLHQLLSTLITLPTQPLQQLIATSPVIHTLSHTLATSTPSTPHRSLLHQLVHHLAQSGPNTLPLHLLILYANAFGPTNTSLVHETIHLALKNDQQLRETVLEQLPAALVVSQLAQDEASSSNTGSNDTTALESTHLASLLPILALPLYSSEIASHWATHPSLILSLASLSSTDHPSARLLQLETLNALLSTSFLSPLTSSSTPPTPSERTRLWNALLPAFEPVLHAPRAQERVRDLNSLFSLTERLEEGALGLDPNEVELRTRVKELCKRVRSVGKGEETWVEELRRRSGGATDAKGKGRAVEVSSGVQKGLFYCACFQTDTGSFQTARTDSNRRRCPGPPTLIPPRALPHSLSHISPRLSPTPFILLNTKPNRSRPCRITRRNVACRSRSFARCSRGGVDAREEADGGTTADDQYSKERL